VLGFLSASAAALATACAATPDVNQDTTILTPDYAAFAGGGTNAGVHTFLEKRCGTLDCHGQVGRPFRLFGQYGLRALNDAGVVSGGVTPDTQGEIYSNYLAAIGLQPEETSRVVAGDDPPTDLLLVAKPTMLETHKGGQVISVGDVSYVCLTSWLELLPNASAIDRAKNEAACNMAAAIP
jgi:hypothetical protein